MTGRRAGVVVALAGPVCSGKTTLASALSETLAAEVVSARSLVAQAAEQAGGEVTRESLQEIGRELERSTGGGWLADAAAACRSGRVVIDSARTPAQVRAVRDLPGSALVVYLTASLDERRKRFLQRSDPLDGGRRFEQVLAGELSDSIEEVASIADLVLDTDDLDRAAVHRIVRDAVG